MIGAALIRGQFRRRQPDQNHRTPGSAGQYGPAPAPARSSPEQRDFVRTLIAWMTDREELRGLGSRHDLTVKLNLDRNALGVLELLTNIGFPCWRFS